MPPNLTKPVAVSQMSPRRLPDDSQTTPRRLPDDSRTTPRRLPDVSQTTPRPLPDDSQTTPRRLPDVSPTSPRRLGDVCRVYSTVYCARGEQSVWAVTNRTDLHPRLLRPPHISIIYFIHFPLFLREGAGAGKIMIHFMLFPAFRQVSFSYFIYSVYFPRLYIGGARK